MKFLMISCGIALMSPQAWTADSVDVLPHLHSNHLLKPPVDWVSAHNTMVELEEVVAIMLPPGLFSKRSAVASDSSMLDVSNSPERSGRQVPNGKTKDNSSEGVRETKGGRATSTTTPATLGCALGGSGGGATGGASGDGDDDEDHQPKKKTAPCDQWEWLWCGSYENGYENGELRLTCMISVYLQQLAMAIEQGYFSGMTSLHIEGFVNNVGALAIASALPLLTGLTDLHIDGLNDDAGAQTIATVLPSLTNLTALYIGGDFNDEGAEAIAYALQSLTNLTALHIHWDIGYAATQAIATALPSLANLTALHISGFFNDEGAQAIATVLPSLANLTALHISGDFNDKGVQAIVMALSSLNSLTDLYLFGRDVSTETVQIIETRLRRSLKSLTKLHIVSVSFPRSDSDED